MKIHLAILTFNALAHTKRCLESLFAHTTLPFEVQIVDNASSDGTQAWLASLSDPKIRIHYSPENLGVPGGRNELLRRILPRAMDGDFVVFLDNDIELHEGWHGPYERLFAAQPHAGLASKVGWVMQVREDTRDPQAHPWETGRVDIVAGGFACWARVEAIRQVGTQDENLGLFWHEDDDWALRFAAHGWSVWAVPEAPMTHDEHASGVAWPSLENGDSLRNLAYLTEKWRRLGFVDAQGWPCSGDALFCPSIEVRNAIGERLGRLDPISRGEYVESYWDLHALWSTLESGRVFPRPVSPCLGVLLDMLREGLVGTPSPALLARCEELSRLLGEVGAQRSCERTASSPHEDPAGCRHGLVLSSSWEDETWLSAFKEWKGPEATADWYGRSAKDWITTSAFVALGEAGLLGPGTRGLILDPYDVDLGIALAGRRGDVLLAGHLDIAGEARGELPPEILTHPERWFGNAVARPRICRRSDLAQESPFDFVITRTGLVTEGEDPELVDELECLESLLKPGGMALVAAEVLMDIDGRGAFAPERTLCGYELLPSFGNRVDRDTLAACPAPVNRGRTPTLCQRRGAVFETRSLLLYKKTSVSRAALLTPKPHQERQVLVDLRGMIWERTPVPDATREGLAQIHTALCRPGAPEVTLLGEGPPPPALCGILAHPRTSYRDASREITLRPDLIQYLEGPRQRAPHCCSAWKGLPRLAWQTAVSRDALLRGEDRWGMAAYLRFVQREATLVLSPEGIPTGAWEELLDLSPDRQRILRASQATLQASAVSIQEAASLLELEGPYVLLEGSRGAREGLAEILQHTAAEMEGQEFEMIAFGPEFQGFEALRESSGSGLLSRTRFTGTPSEAIRKPLLAGALMLVDARQGHEFRLGGAEAASLGVPVRRLWKDAPPDDSLTFAGSAAAGVNPDLGEVWSEVLGSQPGGRRSSTTQEHLPV